MIKAQKEYIGFDSYSQRYAYELNFESVFDKTKFEMNFNMNFRAPNVQAEPGNNKLSVKVVFSGEEIKIQVNDAINKVLG